jgi:hypothetical protein
MVIVTIVKFSNSILIMYYFLKINIYFILFLKYCFLIKNKIHINYNYLYKTFKTINKITYNEEFYIYYYQL